MSELDMVINALNCFGAGGDSPECPCAFRSDGVPCETKVAQKAQELLKKQKQIKSPDEFRNLLLGMFDSIWDVEIDHPVFQDTVGELMDGVLQAYEKAVQWI